MSVEWIGGDPEEVFTQGYDDWTLDINGAIYLLAKRFESDIETWMKENAPWTDRTGNLRQSLWADVEQFVNLVVIAFDYGLEYGFWLEVANQGKYQIIGPALDRFSELWIQALKELLS